MNRVRSLFLAFLALSLVGCDHATKHAALESFRFDAVEMLGGFLTFTYTENRDMAFGALGSLLGAEARLWLLSVAKIVAIAVGVVLLVRRRRVASTLERLAIVFFVSGALGNLLDRLVRGYVVDFIQVPHWPVFNVADVVIAVGAGLFFLDQFGRSDGRSSQQDAELAPSTIQFQSSVTLPSRE